MADKGREWPIWSDIPDAALPVCTLKLCSLCHSLILAVQEELDGHERFHERLDDIALHADVADLEAIGGRQHGLGRRAPSL